MCTVEVEHKNNKKKYRFFLVSRGRQALLGMPDTDALNIIKININSIGAEQAKCCTNMHTVWGSGPKQEMVRGVMCYTNMDSISNSWDNKTKPIVEKKIPQKQQSISFQVLTMKATRKATQQIHKDFDDVFNGMQCFEGTFSLQLKPDSKSYQVPPRWVAYTFQKPFQEEVRLCLNPACLNQALIRPIHRGPTLNKILLKLNNAKHLSLTDASSWYHSFKLDEKSS